MKKCVGEIYANIVSAPIGEPVSTRHKNGNYYNGMVEDMLANQGYKKDVDYETVFDWPTCITYIKRKTEIRPYEEPKHNIKVGDIFYHSWGYDQTNIDFYQVVSVTAKTISIRRIVAGEADYDDYQMTGHKVAIKDRFAGDKVLVKTPHLFAGEWRLNFEYGSGGLWDGKPMDFSRYA